jgi:hypothetical protein
VNAYVAFAIAVIGAVVFRLHLTVNAAGLTVTVSVPLIIVVGLVVALAVLVALILREVCGLSFGRSWA